MTDRNVSIRIGVTGKEETKRAFDEVGKAGQDAFSKTAMAADTSGAAIDRETARLQRLAAAARQAAGADDAQRKFNAFMGVGATNAGSARDSAAVFIANARATEELEARTRALRAQIDPLGIAQARLNAEIAEANALYKAGAITAAEQAAAHQVAQVRFDATAKSLRAVGGTSQLASYQITNLGFQLNDVIVGLASGQRPLTVLVQQGTQIAQVFAGSGMGVGGVLRSLGGVIAGLVTPATALAGGLIAIGGAAIYAYDSYLNSQKELEVATAGLGRAAGATIAELNAIASAAADVGKVSVASARDMEIAFLRAGVVGSQQFSDLIAVAKNYAATTGQELPEATKELAQAFADPARGIDLLNSKVGGFDDKTRELIRMLVAQNDTTRAQKVLLDALQPSLIDAADATTALGRAWDFVARKSSDAFNAMGEAISAGVDPTLQQRLEALLKERETASTSGGTWASGLGGMVGFAPSRPLAEIDAEISEVRRVIGMAELAAARARADADATRASTQAGSLARSLVPGASDLQKLKDQQALLKQVLDSPLASSKVADLDQVAQAYKAVSHAIDTYLDPAEKARRLDQLEIDALNAKTPAQKAAIAAERRRVELAGEVVTAATAEADIARKGAIAHAQAESALERHNAALAKHTTALERAYEQVRQDIVAQGNQIELTQKQIALVGSSQSLAAIEIAQLQAKHELLQRNIDLGSAEAQAYIANAATPGQPEFPWRGRITCSPAAGFAGSVDKTGTAATQVTALFGAVTPGNFNVSGETVSFTGSPSDWGLRRMVLHYAHLCAAAGGVDAFLIGTEMPGLTTIRSGASSYPAVTAFKTLAADVRSNPHLKTQRWAQFQSAADIFNNIHLDPLWSDASIDFVGIDNYLPLSDWRDGFDHADALDGWPAIYDRAYLQSNIAGGEGFDWFYAGAADRSAQIRTAITDGAAAKPWVFRPKDIRAWWTNPHYNRPGGVESGTPTAWVPQSKPIRFTELGCPAIDRGTNQPNVFFDPKSSESFTPYFSRGWRDDAIQRAYLEASYLHWGDPANNPNSAVYGGRMVHLPECAAWTWDARPYPFFPELTDVWTDGPNWRLGHWLTGRLGAVSLAALVRHLCLRAGMPEALIDVSGLWGAVEGYVISALEAPRSSISTLARHFGFDAIETEGMIRFVMRGRASSITLTHDDLVASREGEALEMVRAQETELPQALKWQVARADEDYDAALVEARRITVDTTRIASESFPMAIPPEEAERRCRRALMEAWIGRESATFRLPPSRLALDPADVIRLVHDGREIELRLVSIADSDGRGIEAVRQDRAAYDLPPGDPRPASLTRSVVFGAPDVVLLDLPQLSEDQPAHRPMVAAHAVPWPGEMAVFRSPSTDGFDLLTTFGSRARIGTLVSDFHAGPTSRFDLGNALVVDLASGTLESVTDLTLFGGANALAVETASGIWEIVQAGAAELIAPGRYRLTRLLRGQRGTEAAMGNPTPAGARVVVLDSALAPLPIAEADLGLPWNWRIGPAARAVSDASYTALAFMPSGRGLMPFAPVHVEQPWRIARSPGDLTLRWTRRSRALVADAWEQIEVPLAEDLESYDVQIRDGAVVKRTLTSGTTSVLYTAAQQTADWGTPLGPGQTLAIRIYQLSNRLGRGDPAAVTLQF